MTSGRERIAQVAMTLRRRQAGLRGGGTDAAQCWSDGEPEVARQIHRLIEPAMAAS